MLKNADLLEEGTCIQTQICIIGSGPAGLSVANEFLGNNTSVYVVESGAEEFNRNAQRLNKCRQSGDAIYTSLAKSRRRQLGGLSHAWGTEISKHELGVMYAPLSPIDFEKRNWIPNSGWPIDYDSLVPYYESAQRLCKSGPFEYGSAFWETGTAKPLSLPRRQIETTIFQFGSRKAFTEDCVDAVKSANNINVLTHATVTELVTNDDAKIIDYVEIRTSRLKTLRLTAKFFVLATGGIENPRLLLLSNKKWSRGLGNHYGHVGRYFMDHPVVRSGTLVPNSKALFNTISIYDLVPRKGNKVMGKLSFHQDFLRKNKFLDIATYLFPRSKWHGSKAVSSSAKMVGEALIRGRIPTQSSVHTARLVTNLPDLGITTIRKALKIQPPIPSIGRGGWSLVDRKEERFDLIEIVHATEQAPHMDNRVTLCHEKDLFGKPIPKLHWEWREKDREHVRKAQRYLADIFRDAGIGTLKIELENAMPQLIESGRHHHIGTTRMSDDAKDGVVDSDLKVHGLGNLFVCGSSVFPTAGYANPTLTIVALAIRLGQRLQTQI